MIAALNRHRTRRPRAAAGKGGRSGAILLASVLGHRLALLVLLRSSPPEPPRLLDEVAPIDVSLIEAPSSAPNATREASLAGASNVMRHQIETYAGAGMDGHIAKPFDAEALIRTLANSLAVGASEEAGDLIARA